MNGVFRMVEDGRAVVREVELQDGRLVITPAESNPENWLVPGFVDLHVHGCFGIDFMSASAEQMDEMSRRLEALGYEAYLPTTVTATASDVLRALVNLSDDSRTPGFHLEGPFISPKFPGAQPPNLIVEPPKPGSEWDAVLEHPKLKVVTLAPECPGALDLVWRLRQRGVKVSMGHTNATYAEAQLARPDHATHTFNAMRGLHHREAGALGYVLAADDLKAELIYDGIHVSREAAQILFRCKGVEGVLAVSDGTMASGLPEGSKVSMWGHDAEVRGGGVYLKGTDTLAGSSITLLEAFQNLARDFGPVVAVHACSLNPRRAFGMSDPVRRWVELDPEFRLVSVHSA